MILGIPLKKMGKVLASMRRRKPRMGLNFALLISRKFGTPRVVRFGLGHPEEKNQIGTLK